MKRCSQCGRHLPETDFHKDSKTASLARGWRDDGLVSQCKTCRAAWVSAHRDHIARYNAEYYRRNREKRIPQIHQYQHEHPEVKRVAHNRRRAKKLQSAGHHTARDLVLIYDEQEGYCFYCKKGPITRAEGHFDHVVPLVRGGNDGPENIVFACERCNREKHTRTMEEFLRFRKEIVEP